MKILNFGSCNVDYVYSLDHIAVPGETEATQGLSILPGGKGLNQSIAIRRAGNSVYHAGCIGDGGEFLLDLLKENDVDVSFVDYVNAKNGHAVIQVSKAGDNAIFLYSGSNHMISTEQVDKILSAFSKDDILLLQNEINNLDYIVKKAYQAGMKIFLNPSPFDDKIRQIDLNMISYLILNEIESKEISKCTNTQEALAYFREKFPELKVMLTLGSKGCIYQDKNEQRFCPIFKVDAVDTTGAGDTFTGYFVVGIANENKIEKILEIASCASAISVTRKGAAPSIPHMDEVIENISSLKRDEADMKAKILRIKIEKYFDENLSDASLDGLANFLGYSPIYTSALVKKITNENYKKFLQQKRLELSETLLLQTDLSIDEIVKKAGYENASFFRRKFKERYGTTPLNYRKRKVK